MGVRHLWGFLLPIKKHVTLESLNGQIIAVDLSIWIVEAQNLLLKTKPITKPHLRHLFFRVTHLLDLGIIPLVVIEGIPPDLKQNVMKERLGKSIIDGSVKRSRFNALHRECCEMLDYMGLPYIQAAGEAEAMCAFLNAEGFVDGCITNDGDAFLYGAKMVYRNFTINHKDPHVEAYCAREIEEQLKLSRQTFIGLAILCGCDYLPKGVAGCGKATIEKFLKELNGESILKRFEKWMKVDRDLLLSQSASKLLQLGNAELTICRRALFSPGFPFQNVISEFLINRNKIPKISKEWLRPKLFKFMNFACSKMEWVEEYTISKIIPLTTMYDIKHIIEKGHIHEGTMKPVKIVKNRVRQGVPCFEVQWKKLDGDTYTKEEYYTTFEDQVLFTKAFPHLVGQPQINKPQIKKNTKKVQPLQIQQNKVSLKLIDDIKELTLQPDKEMISRDNELQENIEKRKKDMTLDDYLIRSAKRRRSRSVSAVTKNVKKHLPKLPSLVFSDSDDSLEEDTFLNSKMKTSDEMQESVVGTQGPEFIPLKERLMLRKTKPPKNSSLEECFNKRKVNLKHNDAHNKAQHKDSLKNISLGSPKKQEIGMRMNANTENIYSLSSCTDKETDKELKCKVAKASCDNINHAITNLCSRPVDVNFSPLKEADFGNFEIDTSILNFSSSFCQTPLVSTSKPQNQLAPYYSISPTPTKGNKLSSVLEEKNSELDESVIIPLFERLKLKNLKHL